MKLQMEYSCGCGCGRVGEATELLDKTDTGLLSSLYLSPFLNSLTRTSARKDCRMQSSEGQSIWPPGNLVLTENSVCTAHHCLPPKDQARVPSILWLCTYRPLFLVKG